RLRILTQQSMAERARVRVGVDGDYSVATGRGEGVAGEQAGGRLADAALARDERDRAAADDRRPHLRDQLAPPQLGRGWRDCEPAAGELVDGAPPALVGWAGRRSQHPLGGE